MCVWMSGEGAVAFCCSLCHDAHRCVHFLSPPQHLPTQLVFALQVKKDHKYFVIGEVATIGDHKPVALAMNLR
jgi:hypothetical protein